MRRIATNIVQPGMVTRKPVYGATGQILLNTGVAIKPQHIFYLRQLKIKSVYIKDERLHDLEVRDIVSDSIRSESRTLINQIIREVDSPSANNKGINIRDQELVSLVARIVEEIIANRDIIVQLADIRSLDSYLFAHSVNCAVISTLIAAKMNYGTDLLHEVALGALLHDMGMVAVPPAVVGKQGALTMDEFDMVKQHPLYGYELFKKFPSYTPGAAAIIAQHHERCHGQGYPRGLYEDDIAGAAHIIAITDVFDALTSDKPNRPAYRTDQAIEMLMSWGGDFFHLDTLRYFLANIAAYPAGTHVFLSNGESGFVIANTPGYALRPRVRVLYRGDDLAPHPAPYDLDLTEALDLAIVKVIEVAVAEVH